MARIDLQIYRYNTSLTRALQDRGYQCRADASRTVGGRDIKLLKPCDKTTMLCAQNRGDIRGANNPTFVSRQQKKATRSISHHFL